MLYTDSLASSRGHSRGLSLFLMHLSVMPQRLAGGSGGSRLTRWLSSRPVTWSELAYLPQNAGLGAGTGCGSDNDKGPLLEEATLW